MTTPASLVSIVVPTNRRPEMLSVCLRALAAQTLPPLEVIVAYRKGDIGTERAIASLGTGVRDGVRPVVIGADENLAAGLRAGIAASRGAVVTLTDDDAEPPPGWLGGLLEAFADPTIGGVGGRDILANQDPQPVAVGKVQWFGRMIGNHHLGSGPPRDVDFLKGVNCAFRGDLLRSIGIDPRLVGGGNVVHTELAICLPLRRAGWRLVYDPSIEVMHHAAPRKDGDDNHRDGFNAKALADLAHNEAMLLHEHLTPVGRLAYIAWSLGVGTRFTPGLVQLGRLFLETPSSSVTHLRRYLAAQSGFIRGSVAAWRRRGDGPTPLAPHRAGGKP